MLKVEEHQKENVGDPKLNGFGVPVVVLCVLFVYHYVPMSILLFRSPFLTCISAGKCSAAITVSISIRLRATMNGNFPGRIPSVEHVRTVAGPFVRITFRDGHF